MYLPKTGKGIRHSVSTCGVVYPVNSYSLHTEWYDEPLPTFSWLHQALSSPLLWYPSYLPSTPSFISTPESRLCN